MQAAKIPCWCLCQALVADSVNDLLKIPLQYVSASHCREIPYLYKTKNNLWVDGPINICDVQPHSS